jgi:hypothetical protein
MASSCDKNKVRVPSHIKRYIDIPLGRITIIRDCTALALRVIMSCMLLVYA